MGNASVKFVMPGLRLRPYSRDVRKFAESWPLFPPLQVMGWEFNDIPGGIKQAPASGSVPPAVDSDQGLEIYVKTPWSVRISGDDFRHGKWAFAILERCLCNIGWCPDSKLRKEDHLWAREH